MQFNHYIIKQWTHTSDLKAGLCFAMPSAIFKMLADKCFALIGAKMN